ncbi:hypothetical protein FRC01_006683, partial [Tulasnella sp. 417]
AFSGFFIKAYRHLITIQLAKNSGNTPQSTCSPIHITEGGKDLQGLIEEMESLDVFPLNLMHQSNIEQGGSSPMSVAQVDIDLHGIGIERNGLAVLLLPQMHLSEALKYETRLQYRDPQFRQLPPETRFPA